MQTKEKKEKRLSQHPLTKLFTEEFTKEVKDATNGSDQIHRPLGCKYREG